jgi:hypothetical protein
MVENFDDEFLKFDLEYDQVLSLSLSLSHTHTHTHTTHTHTQRVCVFVCSNICISAIYTSSVWY